MTHPGLPAFPTTEATESGHPTCGYEGLTKREWFAGMALRRFSDPMIDGFPVGRIVSYAVRVADALIAELNKPKESQ